MLHDSHGHELLSVVTAVHHEGVHQPLDDGALCFTETLCGIPPGAVGKVLRRLLLNGYVVLENKAQW